MPSPRILPWRNWREFDEVCTLVLALAGRLSNSSVTTTEDPVRRLSRDDARVVLIEKLAEWHSRSKCPNAVTATFALAQLDWSSSAAALQRETLSPLQLAAAATISRVINALSDSAQSGVFASSISELMKKAGVARWIVDIRHDCSHGAMPSIPVLRLAADYILDYVINEYWLPQSKLAAVPKMDDIQVDFTTTIIHNGISRRKGEKGGKEGVGVKRKRTEDSTRLYFREHSQSWRRALESISLSAGGGGGGGSNSGIAGTSPKSSPTSAAPSRLQNLLTAVLRLVDFQHLEQLSAVEVEDSTTLFPPALQVIIDESTRNKVLSEGITRIVHVTVMQFFEHISRGLNESVSLQLFMVRMFSIQAVSPDATLRALSFMLNDEFKLEMQSKAHRTELVKLLMSRHWASYFDASLAKRSGFEQSLGEGVPTISSSSSSLSTSATDEDIHDIAQWPKTLLSQLDEPAPAETLFGYMSSSGAKSIGTGGASIGKKGRKRSTGGAIADAVGGGGGGGGGDIDEDNQSTPRSSTCLFLDRCLLFPLMMTTIRDEGEGNLLSYIEKSGLLPLIDQERGQSTGKSKHPRWRK